MPKLLRRTPQPSSSHNQSTQLSPARESQKKALIIGINYVEHENGVLQGTHSDARGWMKLCIEKYGFREQDITLMLDDKSIAPNLQPTRANILYEINRLVEGVQPGDDLVFFYSGHTGQLKTDSLHEDDGMDEFLMPVDNEGLSAETAEKLIRDNELRRLLVDPLPVESTLTAIFDSCHSGTLLDLDHYLCNDVYFPFMSRGPRGARSKWMHVGRKNGYDMRNYGVHIVRHEISNSEPEDKRAHSSSPSRKGVRIHQYQRLGPKKMLSIDTALARAVKDGKNLLEVTKRKSITDARVPSLPLPNQLPIVQRTLSFPNRVPTHSSHTETIVDFSLGLTRCTSPENVDWLRCTGDCSRSSQPNSKPRVISIAACRDPEIAYEMRSQSMTKTLIELLEDDPHPPVRQLVTKLGHKMHSLVRFVQKRNKRNMERRSRGENVPVRDIDFFVPQIGTQEPLTAGDRFMQK